jgi:hypothetical protein
VQTLKLDAYYTQVTPEAVNALLHAAARMPAIETVNVDFHEQQASVASSGASRRDELDCVGLVASGSPSLKVLNVAVGGGLKSHFEASVVLESSLRSDTLGEILLYDMVFGWDTDCVSKHNHSLVTNDTLKKISFLDCMVGGEGFSVLSRFKALE